MRRSNGTTLHGQTPGFLGAGHSSFAVDQSLLDEKVEIEALKNPAGLDGLRLTDRANLRGNNSIPSPENWKIKVMHNG